MAATIRFVVEDEDDKKKKHHHHTPVNLKFTLSQVFTLGTIIFISSPWLGMLVKHFALEWWAQWKTLLQ